MSSSDWDWWKKIQKLIDEERICCITRYKYNKYCVTFLDGSSLVVVTSSPEVMYDKIREQLSQRYTEERFKLRERLEFINKFLEQK
jgi:hypothetical protein